jgi:hypothetical protein
MTNSTTLYASPYRCDRLHLMHFVGFDPEAGPTDKLMVPTFNFLFSVPSKTQLAGSDFTPTVGLGLKAAHIRTKP